MVAVCELLLLGLSSVARQWGGRKLQRCTQISTEVEEASHGWGLSSEMEEDDMERKGGLRCMVNLDGEEDVRGWHGNGEKGVKREWEIIRGERESM